MMNQVKPQHRVALENYFDELLNESTEKLLQDATEATYQTPDVKIEPMYLEPIEALAEAVEEAKQIKSEQQAQTQEQPSSELDVQIGKSETEITDSKPAVELIHSQPDESRIIETAEQAEIEVVPELKVVPSEPEVATEVPVIETAVTEALETEALETRALETKTPEAFTPSPEPHIEPQVEPQPDATPIKPNVEEIDPKQEQIPHSESTSRVETAAVEKKYPKAPDWAQYPFECLLFDVSGLTLAVPMVQLGGISEVTNEDLSSLFGQPGWHMGINKTDEVTLGVVDTAHLIMPEQNLDLKDQTISHILRLEKSDWALASIGIKESITLEPDEVRWRTNRGSRPWLYGTVIDHMCALLDVTEVINLLEKDSKPAA